MGKRFYSVPWVHVGKEAWLKVTGDHVAIYVNDVRVTVVRTLEGLSPERAASVTRHAALSHPDAVRRIAREGSEAATSVGP